MSVQLLAHLRPERIFHQGLFVDHLLGEGLRVGYDQLAVGGAGVEAVEHLGPLQDIGVLGLVELIGALVGGRE